MQYILDIRSAVAVLNASDAWTELNSRVVLNQVVSKLPHSVQVKWIKHTVRSAASPSLYDLAVWPQPILQTERVLSLNRFTTPRQRNEKTEGRDKKQQNPQRSGEQRLGRFGGRSTMVDDHTVLAMNVVSGKDEPPKLPKKTEPPKEKCFGCGESRHSIFLCSPFVALKPEERGKKIKSLDRCWCCLGSKHKAEECTSKYRCKAEGCGLNPHTLLHDVSEEDCAAAAAKDKKPTAKGGGGGGKYVKFTPHADIFTTYLQPAYSEPQVVLMAVVKVRLVTNKRTIETYALLDGGANSSLIREDLAKNLRLSGRNASMQFNNAFVRDFVPSRETSFTSFSVYVSGGKQFNINAYTTPNINVEHRSLDWDRAVKKWSNLKGMPTPSPSRCTIGILIGMNATKLHIQAKNK